MTEIKVEDWRRAVPGITGQSEKLDRESLVRSYVDMGHLARIHNPTNQYIEGRRGAGKTHLLSYFCEHVNVNYEAERAVAIRIDGRSCNLESDPATAPRLLAKGIFREFMLHVVAALESFCRMNLWQNSVPTSRSPYEIRVADQTERVLQHIRHLISFGSQRTSPTGVVQRSEKDRSTSTTEAKATASAEVSSTPKGQMALNVSAGGSTTKETEQILNTTIEFVPAYLELGAALEEFLRVNDLERFYIAIDEWSSIPKSAQPFFAEALKRAMFPRSAITLKICALPFQTCFSKLINGQVVGFERNGDVFPALDLDDDLVFLNNKEKGRRYFGVLLDRHLRQSLTRILGEEPALPATEEETVELLATEPAFERLLAYAQGNARDFLTLFKHAWESADDRGNKKINVGDVERAAKALGIEKLENVAARPAATAIFNEIVNEVLHQRKKGAFLIDAEFAEDENLLFLIHQRVFHVAERSYSAPRHAGKRFLVLAIDFCMIVDHLRSPNYRHVIGDTLNLELPFTEKQRRALEEIKELVKQETKLKQLEAPDKREVRYTVIDPAILKVGSQSQECSNCGKSYASDHPVVVKHSICPECGESLGRTRTNA